MKKIALYLLLAILCSYQSQEIKKQDILGNWYPIYNDESANSYFEFYLAEDRIYYITKVGWGPSKAYKIERNTFYVENFDAQGERYMEENGSVSIEAGVLNINILDKKDSYARLDSSPNLDDCVNGKFD